MFDKKIFERFIKQELKINDFSLNFFGTGKVNFTCLVKSNKGNFVLQNNIDISKKQKKIIEKVIDFGYKNGLNLAGKKFENRFYEFEGKDFQIMEYINGTIYEYDDFNILELEKIIQYLAIFHNVFEKGSLEIFQDYKNNSKDLFHYISLAEDYNKKNNQYEDIFKQIIFYSKNLKSVCGLRKGIIHGDPILRNFLFDENKNILGLIDYDKISYDDYLWDFVDHIRGYLKNYHFKRKDFEKLLNAYEQIRPFTNLEKQNLENYFKMIVLNTTIRYFISLFDSNFFAGRKLGTGLESVYRGLAEYKKVESFFR